MDTDSIVINIELPEYIKGNKLGQFKLQYKILRAYFMSSKTYCLIVKYGHEEKTVIKIRGVINKDMNEISFIRLYKHQN